MDYFDYRTAALEAQIPDDKLKDLAKMIGIESNSTNPSARRCISYV